MTFTTEITISVEIDCEYIPGEPMVRYYANGDGHPGCEPEAEINAIKLGDVEISDQLDQQLIEELRSEAFARLKAEIGGR